MAFVAYLCTETGLWREEALKLEDQGNPVEEVDQSACCAVM